MADRTHGGNHAPLLNGGWLKPGFCAGCDAERAGEALGSIVHVTHVAADSEEYARIFNEGYEAAMAQHLADDPSAADDWLAAHTAAAKREGARAVIEAVEAESRKYHGVTPFAVKQAMIAAARAALEGGA